LRSITQPHLSRSCAMAHFSSKNDRICQVFKESSSTITMPLCTELLNISGKIVTPGFVDMHHHLWQMLFKPLESNNGLATYFSLFGETGPAEPLFISEDSYLSQRVGALWIAQCRSKRLCWDHAHGLWSNDTADAILNGTMDSDARAVFAFSIHQLNQ
jgi:cytosine/adenosine deaminase-related metal-dependent hydrolase